MSNNLQNAVEEMQTTLQAKLDEVVDLKKAINTLCGIMGQEPLYADVEEEQAKGMKGPARPDMYFNKPVATAARMYLESVGHAVQSEDIIKGLEAGSFDFKALGWTEKTRLRNLSISLAKNTSVFKRLPGGMFGLVKFYDDDKPRRQRARPDAPVSDENFDDDSAGANPPDAVDEEVME